MKEMLMVLLCSAIPLTGTCANYPEAADLPEGELQVATLNGCNPVMDRPVSHTIYSYEIGLHMPVERVARHGFSTGLLPGKYMLQTLAGQEFLTRDFWIWVDQTSFVTMHIGGTSCNQR